MISIIKPNHSKLIKIEDDLICSNEECKFIIQGENK